MNLKDYIKEKKDDYQIHHPSYTSAVQTAITQVEKRGFKVDEDSWWDEVSTGPKKPSVGKTNRVTVKLTKNDKPSKKTLHMQVYGMEGGRYELNMYVS